MSGIPPAAPLPRRAACGRRETRRRSNRLADCVRRTCRPGTACRASGCMRGVAERRRDRSPVIYRRVRGFTTRYSTDRRGTQTPLPPTRGRWGAGCAACRLCSCQSSCHRRGVGRDDDGSTDQRPLPRPIRASRQREAHRVAARCSTHRLRTVRAPSERPAAGKVARTRARVPVAGSGSIHSARVLAADAPARVHYRPTPGSHCAPASPHTRFCTLTAYPKDTVARGRAGSRKPASRSLGTVTSGGDPAIPWEARYRADAKAIRRARRRSTVQRDTS